MKRRILYLLLFVIFLSLGSFNAWGQQSPAEHRLDSIEKELIKVQSKNEKIDDNLNYAMVILGISIPAWLLVITGVVIVSFSNTQKRIKKEAKEGLKTIQKTFDTSMTDYNGKFENLKIEQEKLLEKWKTILRVYKK